MKSAPLPRRTKPLRQRVPLQRRAGLNSLTQLRSTAAPRGSGTPKRTPASAQRPADTGFSAKVKLAIRARAGNGDPDQARCEATGVWLGRHDGEIQHRVARLMGGRGVKVPQWFHTPANGVLLAPGVHRLAEARNPHLHAQGFWLTSTQDASAEPVMLHDASGGGITVWLDEAGGYAFQPPERAA